ncbi:alpha-L-fucosidase [Paludibaculum fermentans]|uniref:alpha-L-fucosidase n=1 Tax=Paludibaculum fermentans TaxID=1473598 RepID=A0A7S7NJZ3_PALFE|nr:alpha-L-fucosidase [Paludibaculum fermentans]QOY84964.1 alpha-L-fucosidase [Paludibaculum fermentans]
MPDRRSFLLSLPAAAGLTSILRAAPAAPAPFGVLPSSRQLLWHEMEVYSFLHFTTNTFTDKEWGFGDESPSIFNPTAFDADAIVAALKTGGMKGVILTCKHHDGFCLWPTRTTEHSVKASPWRGGNGDVVKEISQAAAKHGLKFGVYLSPWDRNTPKYASPEYVTMYRAQLTELLTQYGPIYEVWHDGANGGDGFYGGAKEKRRIDKKTYYDWPTTWALVRKLQPNAVIFSDVGPDIRWVGNEKGYAAETSWATFEPVGEDGGPASPGDVKTKDSMGGTRGGSKWLPAECDVSIRPGWFWHEKENAKVKSSRELMDLYYKSVGRGGSFLLNIPPDRRGLLHETDVASIKGFGDMVRGTFATNLAAKAKVTASNVRGKSKTFGPERLLDGDRYSFWSTDDAVTTAEVVLDLGRETAFNVIRIRENLKLGQRVEGIAVDQWKDGNWVTVGEAGSVGSCRLFRTAEKVTTAKVRLRVTKSPVCPALSEFGLFLEAGA